MKENTSGLKSILARLPSKQLKALRAMADDELQTRGDSKSVDIMSDSEFRKYVDEQFARAEQAAREADLREQLGGKPLGGKPDKMKETNNGR